MSIVVTVLDDRVGLAELLPALEAQRYPADEVIVVDAGSNDGSAELLAYWRARGLPVNVIHAPGAGISAGRNRGIAAAANDFIAVTDAGCRPAPGWLGALARELERCDFVAGTYTVDQETPFEHAVSVTLYPDVSEVRRDLPVSARLWQRMFGRRFRIDRATGRSMAFTRACWEVAGGFPENVNWGEDVAFSATAAATDARSTLAADAVVAWRGRPTWRANARMYWRYAEGDAVLGVKPRDFARGLVWGLAGLLATRGGLRGRLTVVTGAGIYASLPAARAYRTGLSIGSWWRIVAVLAMKDLAMLGGTVAGVRLRAAGVRPPGGSASERAGLQAAGPTSSSTAV